MSIDPAVNPAVLNTGTWDTESAVRIARLIDKSLFQQIVTRAATSGNPDDIRVGGRTAYSGSIARYRAAIFALLSIEDAQTLFIRIGEKGDDPLEDLLIELEIEQLGRIKFYPTTDTNVHAYTTSIHVKKGTHALGPIPRLGIGVRHTTALWPGIFKGLYRSDVSGNAIQNSVRELHLLKTLHDGIPSRQNHLFSFGPMDEGHTGSTFEGLWNEGVLSHLKMPFDVRIGADADHLQVKRGSEGTERTKTFIDASRYYTFYTFDVSDILDYGALSTFSAVSSAEYLEKLIPNKAERDDILWYHRRRKSLAKVYVEFDEAALGRLVGKYWKALDAMEALTEYLDSIKYGEKYDLELSIDENPPFIRTFDSITSVQELLFLVDEIERRGLPVTHLAPNFGVEKGTDYRGDDGIELLERRIGILNKIAVEKNMILDCHSGDDLSRETRRVFKRATRGNIHFKVSPSLQALYGKVLSDYDPEFFDFWWKETLRYAQEGAENGSTFARHALSLLPRDENGGITPSPDHLFFKELCFDSVGKRDTKGDYINRSRFYDLDADFFEEMERVIEQRVLELSEDLFDI